MVQDDRLVDDFSEVLRTSKRYNAADLAELEEAEPDQLEGEQSESSSNSEASPDKSRPLNPENGGIQVDNMDSNSRSDVDAENDAEAWKEEQQ